MPFVRFVMIMKPMKLTFKCHLWYGSSHACCDGHSAGERRESTRGQNLSTGEKKERFPGRRALIHTAQLPPICCKGKFARVPGLLSHRACCSFLRDSRCHSSFQFWLGSSARLFRSAAVATRKTAPTLLTNTNRRPTHRPEAGLRVSLLFSQDAITHPCNLAPVCPARLQGFNASGPFRCKAHKLSSRKRLNLKLIWKSILNIVSSLVGRK